MTYRHSQWRNYNFEFKITMRSSRYVCPRPPGNARETLAHRELATAIRCLTDICAAPRLVHGHMLDHESHYSTGIFVQPLNVLYLTGSSGVAILLWCVGGLIVFAIVLSWLELALTIPLHYIFHNGTWERFNTPRSGGDKNYVCLPLSAQPHLVQF